jgi:hypothetical protein
MDDEYIENAGSFGRYQIKIIIITGLINSIYFQFFLAII